MEEKSPEQGAQEEVKEVVLSIKIYPTGKIDVSGPIANEMLCMFLLEKAKDIIKAYIAKLEFENRPKIEKPHGIMGFARGRF